MFFSYLIIVLFSPIYGTSQSDLFDQLFTNYQKSVRPQTDGFYITNVTLYPTVFNLLEISDAQQTLQFSVDFTLLWTDPLLLWDPSEHDGITSIKIPEQTVWQGDIILAGSLEKTDLIDIKKRLIVLDSNGTVMKSGPQVISVPCETDLTKYPFDHQTCTFKVGAWSYTNTEIKLSTPFTSFDEDGDSFTGNTEWIYKSLTCQIIIDPMYLDEGNYDTMIFELQVRRKSTYYVLSLILPSFFCTVLCLFGLFLPVEITGLRIEKASLGICTLLAMALILEAVTTTMPKSKSLPLLGIFVLVELGLCSAATLLACIYSIIHERAVTREWIPSPLIQTIFLNKDFDRKVRQMDSGQQMNQIKSTPLSYYLQRISKFLIIYESDEKMESIWQRIFDRLDVATMIIFQILNLILTLVMLL